ncbi:CHAT domain-containing protein OS=Streptomyces violarus OX=67380 GN=FHS41_001423 PE=4 SV=1 [Streptomyces violarus]
MSWKAYREAHRHRQDVLDRTDDPEVHTAAHARWRSALEELCDWAGAVVMAPLARSPCSRAAGPQPRLVLVPFGVLGGIPWHAALLSSGLRHGGRPVRAVERMTLSYAASARQLHEVLGRPRLPLDAGAVIVGNPDGTLPGATTEARQIRSALYPARPAARPGARRLRSRHPRRGADGAAEPDGPRGLGPPSGLPRTAFGQLTAGRVPVPRAARRTAAGRAADGPRDPPPGPGPPGRRPRRPGHIDACVSDHTAGDFDESLTLSTAFLAAGATGVVGSRWGGVPRPPASPG